MLLYIGRFSSCFECISHIFPEIKTRSLFPWPLAPTNCPDCTSRRLPPIPALPLSATVPLRCLRLAACTGRKPAPRWDFPRSNYARDGDQRLQRQVKNTVTRSVVSHIRRAPISTAYRDAEFDRLAAFGASNMRRFRNHIGAHRTPHAFTLCDKCIVHDGRGGSASSRWSCTTH